MPKKYEQAPIFRIFTSKVKEDLAVSLSPLVPVQFGLCSGNGGLELGLNSDGLAWRAAQVYEE